MYKRGPIISFLNTKMDQRLLLMLLGLIAFLMMLYVSERKSHRPEPPHPTPEPTPGPIPHHGLEVYPNETAVYDSFVHWKQKHGKFYGKEQED